MMYSGNDYKSYAVAALVCALILLLLSGCRTSKNVYVPVETAKVQTDSVYLSSTKVDSIYVNRIVRDSIYTHDSVYIHEKGDTVLVEKTSTKYIERLRHDTIFWNKFIVDTCYRDRFDSIRVPQPYPVEKELTRWQQLKQNYGGWAIWILIALLVASALYLGYKLKK